MLQPYRGCDKLREVDLRGSEHEIATAEAIRIDNGLEQPHHAVNLPLEYFDHGLQDRVSAGAEPDEMQRIAHRCHSVAQIVSKDRQKPLFPAASLCAPGVFLALTWQRIDRASRFVWIHAYNHPKLRSRFKRGGARRTQCP